ncbi:MAG TPA: hypothetical protein IAB47_02635 [Candidatus Scatomorpha merdigallinarum]|nr:hypothetical protein [Candidatus Scatomorpha merdigallinarum]
MSEEKFNYSYSAKQSAEVEKIRKKYAEPTEKEDKMEKLRRLDASASKPGIITAWCLGIAGALLLGVGMCCTMVWADTLFVPGIVIGVVGIVCVAAAPAVYKRITKKRRKKLAPEILRLTDELMDR